MSRKKKKDARGTPKKYSIFAFVSYEDNSFFIGKSSAANLWYVYRDHCDGKNEKTADVFSRGKECGNLPKMHLIKEVVCSDSEAYKYCIAWSKYLIEHGFSPLVDEMLGMICTPDEKTTQIYEAITDHDFQEIFDESKNLFPNFRHERSKKNTKTSQISISVAVSPEEYQQLKAEADSEHMGLSRYCREILKHKYFVKVDFGYKAEMSAQLRQYANTLDGIITTILLSKKYYPADIENMIKVTSDLRKDIHEHQKYIIKLLHRLRKMSD